MLLQPRIGNHRSISVRMDGQGDRPSMKTRVFVGGLGITVTPDDLEKTFSSLGKVHGAEIVRTNGRSFAYMDFEPSSEKALSKLFSLYNGCMWKGGRLRLEKAKEHYLVRLHREWTEDTAQSANVADSDDIDTPSKEHDRKSSILPQKNGLKIFFPQQKKVKVLPSKGPGKHKYSFQRVESLPVSQLPLCSYDEHSKYLEGDRNNEVDLDKDNNMPDIGVISDKELNIMKRVMERLIGNEEKMQIETEHANKTETLNRGKTRMDMDKDANEGVNDSEAEVKSSDKLDINKKDKKHSIEVEELENMMTSKHELGPVIKDSEDKAKLSRGMAEKIARKDTNEPSSNKDVFCAAKMGDSKCEQEIENEILLSNTNSSPMEVDTDCEPRVLGQQESQRLQVEDLIFSSNQEARRNSRNDIGQYLKDSTESKGHGNSRVPQVQDKSRSWAQKASWKDLVGQTGRVSFSLSSIIGGAGSSTSLVKEKDDDIRGHLENKERKRKLPGRSGKNAMQEDLKSSNNECSESFLGEKVVKPDSFESEKAEPILGLENVDDTTQGREIPMENFAEMKMQDKQCIEKVDKNSQSSGQDKGSPSTCTFMRSENAEAEWLKTKAAVRGYAKAHRKMALKSVKRFGIASGGRF